MGCQLVLLQEDEDGINVVLDLSGALVGYSIRLLQLPQDQAEHAGCSEHEHDTEPLPNANWRLEVQEWIVDHNVLMVMRTAVSSNPLGSRWPGQMLSSRKNGPN